MNIKELIKTQQKLDAAMFKKAGITEYPTNKIRIAYYVELGEALNEWAGFKYWKSSRKENREALLEELADCLHFALSLEGHYKSNEYFYDIYEGKGDFLRANPDEKYIYENIEYCMQDDEYLGNTIALALSMGFTREELVDAYYKKNKKNYERIVGGY